MRKTLQQLHREELIQRLSSLYANALHQQPEFMGAPPNMLEQAAYHAAIHTLTVLGCPPAPEPDVVDVVAARIVAESDR